MPWVITNGNVYISKNPDGSITTTGVLQKALTFEDNQRAHNFCSSLPKTMKRLCFYPTKLTTDEEAPSIPIPSAPERVIVPEVDLKPAECPKEINPAVLSFESFMGQIQTFSDFVTMAVQQRPLLVEAQKQTELEIMDIEHAAEFYNWNAAKGYKAFRLLRDARLRRRQYKDAIKWIDMLVEANPTPFLSANVPKMMNDSVQRTYHPRAFPELFVEATT